MLWLARLVLAGAVIAAVHRASAVARRPLGSARPAATAALAVGSILIVFTSLNGHAAAADSRVAAVSVDAVHLLATVAWLGGLAALRFAVYPALRDRPPTDQVAVLADAVPRFSTLALVCVLALAGTGVYQAWTYLGGPGPLLDTAYGRTLLVKLVLVALVLVPAAVNRFVVHPRLAAAVPSRAGRDDDHASNAARTLRRLVTVEAAVGLLILAVVAVLTTMPPPA